MVCLIFWSKLAERKTRRNFLNSQFPNDCEITRLHTDSCHTSPHPFAPPTWPPHISINWNTFIIPFTPQWWLSHLLTTVTSPKTPLYLLHDHNNSPSNYTPVYTFHTSLRIVRLPDNCYTSPSLLLPWASHLYINWHTFLRTIFHTSLRTVRPHEWYHTFRHTLPSKQDTCFTTSLTRV